jgi:hypothetical protein
VARPFDGHPSPPFRPGMDPPPAKELSHRILSPDSIEKCHIAADATSKGILHMFSVGQRVWHRDGRRSGTVLECDGDRVYIEQDNGAELDFLASDLTATPSSDPGAQTAKVRVTQAPVTRSQGTARQADNRGPAGPGTHAVAPRALTAADITPEHVRVLATVPVRTIQAIADLFERRPRAGKFSALDVAQKLNVITELTTVPYRVMRQYIGSPGELGLVMGKGIADARNPA